MESTFERGKRLRRDYDREHKRSLEQKEEFFAEQARALLTFTKDFTKTMSVKESPVEIKWFEDGELNACYNAVDRHAEKTPDKVAIIYEDDTEGSRKITYKELLDDVVRFSNYFQSRGVAKGDTVAVYMPMVPSAMVACLACARIGASHTVVFGGFSAESLALRIEDSRAKWLFTTDKAQRGGKSLSYLENVAAAVAEVSSREDPSLKGVLFMDQDKALRSSNLVSQMSASVAVELASEVDLTAANKELSRFVPCVNVGAEHILFHLYTSGSTGRPKGVSHSTGGYLLYAALTTLVCFDIEENDVFFCTAELGWITGHSYVMYGPLTLGITSVVFGSVPVHPDPFRLFRAVERHKATHLYTAPTVIRLLQKCLPTHLVKPLDPAESQDILSPAVDHVPNSPASTRSIFTHGINDVFRPEAYRKSLPADSPLHTINLSSLRVLGSVGEPINKGAYIWFSMFFGNGKAPLVDTYWQTEAGGVMISPVIGRTLPHPESASFPFFGMDPVVIKKGAEESREISEESPGTNGILLFKGFWPGIARTIVGNHQRYESAYFLYPGHFYTGDEVCKDSEEYFWIRGRVDDVINVSGHRLSTAEIESAVCSADGIAEAAALGEEDEITGQGICIFVVTHDPAVDRQDLFERIKAALKQHIGSVVFPKRVVVCTELPKTSTGKMMRRVLRKLLEGQEVGDTSTCINPDSIRLARASLAMQ